MSVGASTEFGSEVNFMRKAINTPDVVTAGKINYLNVYSCVLFALFDSTQITLAAEHRDAENNLFLLQKNINALRLLGGLHLAGGMDVCPLRLLCVVR